MRHKIKRWFAGLLSVVMFLSLLPVTAMAEGTTPTEGTAIEQVQILIDALPGAEEITAGNRADVQTQIDAINAAMLELTGDEAAALDTTRYDAAVAALAALDAQPADSGPAPNAEPGPDTSGDPSADPGLHPSPTPSTGSGAQEQVQALIDALPDAGSITAETRNDVQTQIDAIKAAMSELTGDEAAALDTSRYDAAVAALAALDAQPADSGSEPSAGSGTESDPDTSGDPSTGSGAQEQVQALINALPGAEGITADNRADVQAQIDAIKAAMLELTGDEAAALDTTRYDAAVAALAALDAQPAESDPDSGLDTGANPDTDTGAGSGTESGPALSGDPGQAPSGEPSAEPGQAPSGDPDPDTSTGSGAQEQVQALIDALPGAEGITADNRADVQAQIDAVNAAMSGLTEDEAAALDTSRYDAAVAALAALDAQPAAPGGESGADPSGDPNADPGPAPSPDPGALEQVQALIDALPDAETITSDNRADVEAQLTAIDEAKLALGDEELDALDITRYLAAMEALLALDDMAGADEPMATAMVSDVSYVDANGAGKTCSSATEVDESAIEWTEGWYVVNKSVVFNDRITVNGTVDLILADGCSLTAGKGITVMDSGSLTIWGQSKGTGKLSATGDGEWLAGIGGVDQYDKCGAITINGGIVDAAGGMWTAGIGGEGATITINGGNVRAVGGYTAAGIGGVSSGSKGGTITITGGTVDARGGYTGAGIGNGDGSTQDNKITISGGFVTAGCPKGLPAIRGDFSTGSDGNAVIVCDAIKDTTTEDDWSGIFCSGSGPEMNVYGEQTLTEELSRQFPSVTLNVRENAVLTVADGVELTLKGESAIAKTGRLINNGNITNNGDLINKGKVEDNGTIVNNGHIKSYGSITGGGSITGNPLGAFCKLTVGRVDFGVTGRDYTPSELPISIHNEGPDDAVIEKVEVNVYSVSSASASKIFEIIEGNRNVGAGQTDTSWKIKPVKDLPVNLYYGTITVCYYGMDDTVTHVPVEFKVFLAGEGTPSSPALISDLTELEMFRDIANVGLLREFYPGMYFKLTDDIDMSSRYGADIGGGEVSWTPIGDGEEFRGTFDGGGHTISGLYINHSDGDHEGLFSEVGKRGAVKNLTVGGMVVGSAYCAGIVAGNKGTVENCRNTCNIIAEKYCGGVVGDNEGGAVANCYNTGNIESSGTVGGIVGVNNEGGTVTSCYNTGSISGSGTLGGIAGENKGTVANCYYSDTAPGGVGDGDGSGTAPKTEAAFTSGEVACLLQSGQPSQIWGQTVGSGIPELTGEAGKKVYRITGVVEGQDDIVWYSNNKATLPDAKPSKEGFTFAGWSTAQGGSADFTAGVTVSVDMTVYAVFTEIQRADGTGTVTMADYTCGDTSVMPVAKSDTNGIENVTYTYTVKGQNDYGDTKPSTAGEYTVRAVFAATDDYNEVTATADFRITHQFNAGWEHRDDGDYHLCVCGVGLLLETKELTEVPEGLRQNPNTDTVEKIGRILVEKLGTGDHYVIYDVELEALTDGKWVIVTPENFPEEGVSITLPYPEGTNSRYAFVVAHMFTTAGSGHMPGDTEILEAANETDGIHFTVKSFSPIAIGWKAGNLTVTVTDTGEDADLTRQWQFRVELDDKTISGEYGDMRFIDGVAGFTLQSGQSLTARNLPEGVAYTVTELNGNQDGYTTTYTDDRGTITGEQDMVAAFINDRPAPAQPDNPPDDPGTQPETQPDTQPETQSETQLETQPDTQPETQSETQSETQPETPSDNEPGDAPKTGDESHLALWFSLMALSLIGITVTVLTPVIRRKKPAGTNGRHMRK